MKKTVLILSIILLFILNSNTLVFGNELLEYKIKEDWNLVNFDVIDKISMEYFDKYNIHIYYLDPHSKEYVGGNYEEIEKVVYNYNPNYFLVHGFWLYTDKSFKVEYSMRNQGEVNLGIESIKNKKFLIKGWNILSLNALSLDRSLDDVLSKCDVNFVYHYDRNRWNKLSEEDLSEKNTLDSMGHSLAVKVKSDCLLNFLSDKKIPKIPSLPI